MTAEVPEATLAALEAAAEYVLVANHTGFQAPASTDGLYARAGAVVELLSGLKQVAMTLSAQVDDATAAANAQGALLDSDDGQPPGEYIDAARSDLLVAAAEIHDALRLANEAWLALAHLKIVVP